MLIESPDAVSRLVWSPTGQLLATVAYDVEWGYEYDVRLWDASSGREVATLATVLGRELDRGIEDVQSLAFISDRELLVAGPARGACVLWNADTVRPWPKRAIHASALLLVPDGKTLIVGSGSDISVVAFPSGARCCQFPTLAEGTVDHGYLVSNATRLAALCADRWDSGDPRWSWVGLWDLQRGKRLRTYDLGPGEAGHPLALHPDGHLLALVDDRRVRSFGMDTEENLEGFTPFTSRERVLALRYAASGSILEVFGQTHLFRLEAVTGRLLETGDIPSELANPDLLVIDSADTRIARAERGSNVIEVVNLPAPWDDRATT